MQSLLIHMHQHTYAYAGSTFVVLQAQEVLFKEQRNFYSIFYILVSVRSIFFLFFSLVRVSEMGNFKRNQERKKTRKNAFDQESDQEKKLYFLLDLILGRFLYREHVFFLFYFLIFFHTFSPRSGAITGINFLH